MEKTFKFKAAMRLLSGEIEAVIADESIYEKEDGRFVSRPRTNEVIVDQNGSQFFVKRKHVDGKYQTITLTPSSSNTEEFDHELEFSCRENRTTEHIPLDHISSVMEGQYLGATLQKQKNKMNFSSPQKEKDANSVALKNIKEILFKIDRPAQSRETQYAIKALEEAAMWLSKRNMEITRNK